MDDGATDIPFVTTPASAYSLIGEVLQLTLDNWGFITESGLCLKSGYATEADATCACELYFAVDAVKH